MMGAVEAALTAAWRTRGYLSNPFKGIQDKPQWKTTLRKLPLPSNRYVIFFTPRSGSSRLTDLLERAGGLGSPGECFNPRHIPNIARSLGVHDLSEYIDLLLRKRATNNTFGCEVTIEHLYAAFFTARRFFELYQPTSAIFLIRENIVEQAVSLSRMAQTGVAHRVSSLSNGEENTGFQYRSGQIRRKLLRILSMERQSERLISIYNLQPLRLSYEALVNNDPAIFVQEIGRHVRAKPERVQGLASAHQKVGDEQSLEFARRFSAENKRLLLKIERNRARTLAALALQEKNHCARIFD